MTTAKTLTPALRRILDSLGDHSEIVCEIPSRTFWIRKKGVHSGYRMASVQRTSADKLIALGAIKSIGRANGRETYETVALVATPSK